MRTLLLLGLPLALMAGPRIDDRAEWKPWAPRTEIAPRTWVDAIHYRTRPGALAISGASIPAVFGGWHFDAPASTGRWYRLTAFYRTAGVPDETTQLWARLDWLRTDGKRASQPEYAWKTAPAGEWTRITVEAPAPERAATAQVQLYLLNAAAGTVWWDDVTLEEIAAPPPRNVTVATINLRPERTGSAAESVRQFLATVERTAPEKVDVILLPEGITIVGTGKTYAEVAEPLPGPTTAALAEVARKRGAYVVAGLYEREGASIYNTAVLLDRKGNLAGKYRKVYLPREEVEGGITAGSDYPVFRTDFGRLGMMICWDVHFADPARALARRGAELLVMPIWGGNETLAKARAIENQVFLVSSGYNFPNQIVDPNGEVLAHARERGTAAVATIDLNRRYTDEWLGNMKGRLMRETRTGLK